MRSTILLLLALFACDEERVADSTMPWVLPGCGNGLLEGDEECDEGAANSDSEPDACRSACLLPSCGDGVADSGEDCDDGDAWGGDGCTPLCEAETGQLESEPNDSWSEAEAWLGGLVHGALTEADADCFSFELPACAALQARLIGSCPAPATLILHSPDGTALAVGAPAEDGCAVLDPEQAPGARFVEEGSWALCVRGLLDGAVPWYALEIEVVDPQDASYVIEDEDDPDGDGKPDQCDDDRDGDGVDDEEDNCPDIPNGPDAAPPTPTDQGFLRAWLAVGPFDGNSSEDSCLPTDLDLLGKDDASTQPALGDEAGEQRWTVLWSSGDRIEYLDAFGSVGAPREVYNALYLHSEQSRELTMAMGPDDGIRVWLNGDVVMEESGCQGTVIDYFNAEVQLQAGWNSLLLKVYDQGGEWGNYARFLDDGEPVTDLELSLSPDGVWAPDQEDSDGDGQGDVCDETPFGE